MPASRDPEPETDAGAHAELVARLRKYGQETDARCEDLRREPAAEGFARSLHGHLARLTAASPGKPMDGATR